MRSPTIFLPLGAALLACVSGSAISRRAAKGIECAKDSDGNAIKLDKSPSFEAYDRFKYVCDGDDKSEDIVRISGDAVMFFCAWTEKAKCDYKLSEGFRWTVRKLQSNCPRDKQDSFFGQPLNFAVRLSSMCISYVYSIYANNTFAGWHVHLARRLIHLRHDKRNAGQLL